MKFKVGQRIRIGERIKDAQGNYATHGDFAASMREVEIKFLTLGGDRLHILDTDGEIKMIVINKYIIEVVD